MYNLSMLLQRHYSPMKLLTALSIGNQAAKIKVTTCMLVLMSNFMIISFQKKNCMGYDKCIV